MQLHQIPYFVIAIFTVSCVDGERFTAEDQIRWESARAHGQLVQESFERCQRFVHGWLEYADSTTGLIPRNLDRDQDIWNAKDAAADNYPFMVLTAALTDTAMLNGRMLAMLEKERTLTSRLDNLPDTYQFSKGGFQQEEINVDDIIFGASEYVKDGLLPLTEWMGSSPWSARMIEIIDDIWKYAAVETKFGLIPSTNVEVNGEMLQVLSRVYWMTDDEKYLTWAKRLGDYYLLDQQHPTAHAESIRLRDHGCEIISGLCELYATVHFADPEKNEVYREPLQRLLHKVLEIGRNEDGLFHDVVNPQTGEIINERIADNFGYNLNGFYTLYQLDSVEAFRDATHLALQNLNENYRNHDWENGSADGYADAIEGALNLFNRTHTNSTADWINSEMQVMWSKQQESGIIEGWHGDGNFARTTIMYALWKSKGTTAHPWRPDLRLGAEMSGDTLWIALEADSTWQGVLKFDIPRHHRYFNLPFDWPRINQFPEWYTVEEQDTYTSVRTNSSRMSEYQGAELSEGIPILLDQSGLKIKLWRR